MIIDPSGLAVGADLIGNKTTVSDSPIVYCCNRKNQDAGFIHLLDTSDNTTRTASLAIPANCGIIIKKEADQFMFTSSGVQGGGANSNISLTPIRYGT
tara:strand:+ start:913 stop:1206 length:294 start_codon:yes stop_codon:yes gene_type:complete